MKNLLVLIILFTKTFGQTPSKIKADKLDTIDYSKFYFGLENQYILKHVKQFKGQIIYELNPDQLYFFKSTGSNQFSGGYYELKENIGDTIMAFDWFSFEKEINHRNHHFNSKISINKLTNELISKVFVKNKKLKILQEKTTIFKIIKMTNSEIILHDITNIEFNRYYYLIRQKPK